MKTVLEVVRGSTEYLERRGIENPRLNAEHLIAHALKKKRLELYLEFDCPLSEEQLAPLRDDLRRRGEGIPLQHLLGTVEFHGRIFHIDGRALVPRPETERFVELLIERLRPNPPRRILDVGTGSGVIALSLAVEFPDAHVTGCDISPEALALAAENLGRLGLESRVELIQADLLPDSPARWDVIAANLPYIPTAEIESLQREVSFDPRLALDGGSDGTFLIERLIGQAPPILAPGGLLALEIGHAQSKRVLDKIRAAGYQKESFAADYQGIDRFLFAHHG